MSNGPLGSLDVRLEKRVVTDGTPEVRVRADVYWTCTGDSTGTVAQVSSEWRALDKIGESDICDLVAEIERRV